MDSKQSREFGDLPLTYHPSPSLIVAFAFRSSEVRRLLLDLYPSAGTEPLGMFPLFLKRTADVMEISLQLATEEDSGPFRIGVTMVCCQQVGKLPDEEAGKTPH